MWGPSLGPLFVFRFSQTDGPNFISFVGELRVNANVKVGGFKAGGLFIKVRFSLLHIQGIPK